MIDESEDQKGTLVGIKQAFLVSMMLTVITGGIAFIWGASGSTLVLFTFLALLQFFGAYVAQLALDDHDE